MIDIAQGVTPCLIGVSLCDPFSDWCVSVCCNSKQAVIMCWTPRRKMTNVECVEGTTPPAKPSLGPSTTPSMVSLAAFLLFPCNTKYLHTVHNNNCRWTGEVQYACHKPFDTWILHQMNKELWQNFWMLVKAIIIFLLLWDNALHNGCPEKVPKPVQSPGKHWKFSNWPPQTHD